MKQIPITLLIAVLSASLIANYFLWKQSNMKTLQVELIELARVK